MKAIILAGGKGSRLQPITMTIPKPLLPLGNKAIIEDIIHKLKGHGFDEFIVCTGYLSEYITAYCGDGSKWGVKINYFKEEKPLGTAGPLAFIREEIEHERAILVMNGDIYTDLDYSKLLDYHLTHDHQMTIACKLHTYTSPFGNLSLDEDNRVLNIIEKPVYQSHINTGIYVMDPGLVREIPRHQSFGMDQLIQRLISRKIKIGAYRVNEFWLGIENINGFEEAIERLNDVEKKISL